MSTKIQKRTKDGNIYFIKISSKVINRTNKTHKSVVERAINEALHKQSKQS